jgi:primosomal protein N' (replication factor Y)
LNVPLDSLLEILDNGAGRGLRSVPVLMPVALDQTYDYLVPEGIEAAPGAFVLVPFGPQTRIGIVWDGPRGDRRSCPKFRCVSRSGWRAIRWRR